MKTSMTLNEAMFLLMNIAGDPCSKEDIDENSIAQREAIVEHFRYARHGQPYFVLEEGQEYPDFVAFHLESTGGEGEGEYCDTHIVIFDHKSAEQYKELRNNGTSLNNPDTLLKFLKEHAVAIVGVTGSYYSYEGCDWSYGEIGLVKPKIERSISYAWA